jgi:transposase InsO family protein
MCAWLGVSRSGFYEWRDRPASATAQRREDLKALVAEIFDDSDETYGYRRVARRRARGTIGGLAVLQRESLTAVRVGPTGNRTSRREEQRTLPNRRDPTLRIAVGGAHAQGCGSRGHTGLHPPQGGDNMAGLSRREAKAVEPFDPLAT